MTPLPTDTLSAHNRGALAFLTGAEPNEPEPGPRGTIAFAYWAGWRSARRAMEASNGR